MFRSSFADEILSVRFFGVESRDTRHIRKNLRNIRDDVSPYVPFDIFDLRNKIA